jgi:hypothetical protein
MSEKIHMGNAREGDRVRIVDPNDEMNGRFATIMSISSRIDREVTLAVDGYDNPRYSFLYLLEPE